jgi:hypothetical protein
MTFDEHSRFHVVVVGYQTVSSRSYRKKNIWNLCGNRFERQNRASRIMLSEVQRAECERTDSSHHNEDGCRVRVVQQQPSSDHDTVLFLVLMKLLA